LSSPSSGMARIVAKATVNPMIRRNMRLIPEGLVGLAGIPARVRL
jgi:hypothetical protein